MQVLGYGWAGLLRKYVVEPAHMWWPGTLVQVSLFRYFKKNSIFHLFILLLVAVLITFLIIFPFGPPLKAEKERYSFNLVDNNLKLQNFKWVILFFFILEFI